MEKTLRACYESIQGDYDGLVERVIQEDRAEYFALMFLDDPSYVQMIRALEDKDYSAAFTAAHTLKGVCANLGIVQLYEVVAVLTELLRGGQKPDDLTMVEQVSLEYERTRCALEAYRESR